MTCELTVQIKRCITSRETNQHPTDFVGLSTRTHGDLSQTLFCGALILQVIMPALKKIWPSKTIKFVYIYINVMIICNWSEPEWVSHIRNVCEFVCLSVCMSVDPCIYNTIIYIYKCATNLWSTFSIVDCSFKDMFSANIVSANTLLQARLTNRLLNYVRSKFINFWLISSPRAMYVMLVEICRRYCRIGCMRLLWFINKSNWKA